MPLLYEHDPDLNEIFVNHISPGTQKHAGNRHGIWQLIEMKPAGQKGINTIWGEFCFIFFLNFQRSQYLEFTMVFLLYNQNVDAKCRVTSTIFLSFFVNNFYVMLLFTLHKYCGKRSVLSRLYPSAILWILWLQIYNF